MTLFKKRKKEIMATSFDYEKSDRLMLSRFQRYESLQEGSVVQVKRKDPNTIQEGVVGYKPGHFMDAFEVVLSSTGVVVEAHIDSIMPLSS